MAFYKDGIISIPNVTGDVVIPATAVETAILNLLDEVGYTNGVRLSASVGNEETLAGACTTGFIPVQSGDIIRIKGFNFAGYPSSSICAYDSSKSYLYGRAQVATPSSDSHAQFDFSVDENRIATITAKINCYLKLSAMCSDGANAFVTKNQPLPVD